MAVIEIAKIQVRRGQELQTGIPQLEPGEFGWAQDTENLYIGKRITEGAADDENTRILTENDLNYFHLLVINNTSTAASSYRYRSNLLQNTTVTSIQLKLDSLDPSLVDFSINASTGTYVQIDTYLQNAIDDIFNNPDPAVRSDRRRILRVPAGWFYLSNTVNLPPYTKLIGAGAGLTKIRYTNSQTSMFRTVDSAGNTFETGNMYLSTGSSRDILIEGMTFEFISTLTTSTSLISLDNVNNAEIKNCAFQTEFNPESTTTYGIVNHGIGIQLRGQGDNGTERCRDVRIENCEFNGLLVGVRGTGTVITTRITNNVFKNLDRGVLFLSQDTLQGPTNGYIAYNRFEDIRQEGIYVGTYPNNKNGNNLSTQNSFFRVGNIFLNEFTTSSSVTSVISYFSPGNKTVDDYFARRVYADSLTNTTGFYYNHYVKGNTTVADSSVRTLTITTGTFGYVKIPLNASNQGVTVNYQLYGTPFSRKGTISANVSPVGGVALTDTYTYVETLVEDTRFITASTGSGINVLILNTATNPRFATVQSSIGSWYMTGENYPGEAAIITSVITSGSFYIVNTDSVSPAFNYWTANTWTLLISKSADVVASYNNSEALSKNFVTLNLTNAETGTSYTFDYQIDIQT